MTTPAGAVADNAATAQREAGGRERAQGGGFFARKYGPLKGWQWSIAAGGLALAYFYYRSRKKAQGATTGTGTGTGYGGEIAGLQREIDALQGGSSTVTTGTGGGSGGSGGGSGGSGTSSGGTTTGGGGGGTTSGGGGTTTAPTTGTGPVNPGGPNKPPGKIASPGNPHMARVGIYAARAAWTAPTSGHATGYEVVRSGAGVNATTGLQHSFVALKPNTHYTWKVRAISTAGTSAWVGGSFTTKKKTTKK